MYIGARMREAPTPIPPNILKMRKRVKLGAKADPMAETVKMMAQIRSKYFLPYLSLSGPETIIAKAAIMVKELTENPSSSSVRLKSIWTNLFTPEITDASNPISSPPKATMVATITIKLEFFISAADLKWLINSFRFLKSEKQLVKAYSIG
jgi:hypothetical protein